MGTPDFIEKTTGIQYVLEPQQGLRRQYENGAVRADGRPLINIHHSAFDEAALLALGLDGSSCRYGRIQLTLTDKHDELTEMGLQWQMPATPAAHYKYLGICLTRYLPKDCIRTRRINGKPQAELVSLGPRQREFAWQERQIDIDSFADPRRWMAKHAIENYLGELPASYDQAKDDCLTINPQANAKRLLVAATGLAVAASGFGSFYGRAKVEGLLPRKRRLQSPTDFLAGVLLPGNLHNPNERAKIRPDARVWDEIVPMIVRACALERGERTLAEAVNL